MNGSPKLLHQSIKGSVAHSNQLFSKEEIANANLAATISKKRQSKGKGKGCKGQSWGNFRQYGKGKGRSYGRGYGSGRDYGSQWPHHCPVLRSDDSQVPLYMKLGERLPWWEQHASPLVV